MNIKFLISNFKFAITVATFMLIFLAPQLVFAASCPSSGTKVPADQQLGNRTATNHEYTGRDCTAIRTSTGSIAGPGEYGKIDDSSCRGACIYEVSYCTPGGCEATYHEYSCSQAPAVCNNPNTAPLSPIGQIFGKIIPPGPLLSLGFGATGISKFLSNLVVLFYSVAAIVLILMILWGAFDWLTSEGDKEKLESAKRKIINAIVGIMLFAVAFAVIQILGTFTGFPFFVGQK